MATEWQQVNLRFTPFQAGIIKEAMGPHCDNLTTAVRSLVADGLRFRMRTYTSQPLNRFLLITHTDDEIFRIYEQFTDAVCTKAGLRGPLDNRYKFEPVPGDEQGTFWPLGNNERLSEDGSLVIREYKGSKEGDHASEGSKED